MNKIDIVLLHLEWNYFSFDFLRLWFCIRRMLSNNYLQKKTTDIFEYLL